MVEIFFGEIAKTMQSLMQHLLLIMAMDVVLIAAMTLLLRGTYTRDKAKYRQCCVDIALMQSAAPIAGTLTDDRGKPITDSAYRAAEFAISYTDTAGTA